MQGSGLSMFALLLNSSSFTSMSGLVARVDLVVEADTRLNASVIIIFLNLLLEFNVAQILKPKVRFYPSCFYHVFILAVF